MDDTGSSIGTVKQQHAPSIATTISALSDDLWCKIFLLIPQRQRLDAMPGTCRHWHSLLARPDMWRRFSCCSHIVDDHRDPAASQLLALTWLQRRASAMTSLHIELPLNCESEKIRWDDEEIRTILLAMSLAPKLQQLSIHMQRRTGIRSGTLAHVQMFTGLTSLACDGIYGRVGSRHLAQLFSGLPALERCSLRFDTSAASPGSDPDASHFQWSGAGFPDTLLQCTRLTSLVVTVSNDAPDGVLDWGALPQNITVLQRLAQMRLQNCLSEPITEALSAVTSLTHLSLCCYTEHFYNSRILSPPVSPALAAVTSLLCVDIMGLDFPSSLPALTGLHDLTLRSAKSCNELWRLSSFKQLSRLRFVMCDIQFGDNMSGLDGCVALVSLQIVQCNVIRLPAVQWYSQLTQLCLAKNRLTDAEMVDVLQHTAQLVTLDVSGNLDLGLQHAAVLPSLQRCTGLRDVNISATGWRLSEQHAAEATLRLKRGLPRVQFRQDGAESHSFDESAAGTSMGCQEGY